MKSFWATFIDISRKKSGHTACNCVAPKRSKSNNWPQFGPFNKNNRPLPEEWRADADVSLDSEGHRGEGGARQRHLRDWHQERHKVHEDVR